MGSSDERVLWKFYFDEEGLVRDNELERDIEDLLLTNENTIYQKLLEYQSMGRIWKSPQDAREWLKELYLYVSSKKI